MSDPVLVLREALAKATEGPWAKHFGEIIADDRSVAEVIRFDDAHLIVAARNLLPAVLDEVEALRKKHVGLLEIYERHTVALQEERDDAKDEAEALRKVVDGVKAAAEGWRPAWGRCCEVHSAATDAYNEAADEVQRLLAVLDKEEEK